MLRRAQKRAQDSSSSDVKQPSKKPRRKRATSQVLGAKSKRDDAEATLEKLVVGGDEDMVEKLQDAVSKEHKIKQGKSQKQKQPVDEDEHPKPAWEDDDDDEQIVKISKEARFRHLHQSGKKKIAGDTYKQSLKSQFEKISGTPNWAKLRWEKKDASDEESEDELLQSTRTYLSHSDSLPKGILNLKRCTHANIENPSPCKLRCMEFHPTAQVMLTAGANQTLNLFQIDGKQNPKIQSVFVERFPIFTAHFSPDGHEVIMGSKHKNFYYYDMISGKVINVPHIKGLEESSLKKFEMSPDGKYIVFMGKYGHMHLISAKSKEWISSLKMNGNVSSIAFTQDGSSMYSTGSDGEVYVWDLNTRDCIHRFVDDGCIDGTAITVSKNGQYLATGSYSGVVNVYNRDSLLTSKRPSPMKAVMNLTTPCTHMKFNATSEILAISSNYAEKALKMVHLPSITAFSNFPTRDDPLRIPTNIDFSLNSGYFAVGNHRGQALLYRVRHYGNY